jgi:hypothetical protein
MSLTDEEYAELRQHYEQVQVLEQERIARENAELAAIEAENARLEEEFARKWREQQAEEQVQWKLKMLEQEERIRRWQADPFSYARHFGYWEEI